MVHAEIGLFHAKLTYFLSYYLNLGLHFCKTITTAICLLTDFFTKQIFYFTAYVLLDLYVLCFMSDGKIAQ